MKRRQIIIEDPEVTAALAWMSFNHRENMGERWMEQFPFNFLKQQHRYMWEEFVEIDRKDPQAQVDIEDADRMRAKMYALTCFMKEHPDGDVVITAAAMEKYMAKAYHYEQS